MKLSHSVNLKEFQIGRYDGETFKPLSDLTKEELVNIVECLHQSLLNKTTELEAIVKTMNKFLCKDHAEQMQKLLEFQDQTNKTMRY